MRSDPKIPAALHAHLELFVVQYLPVPPLVVDARPPARAPVELRAELEDQDEDTDQTE